MSAGADTFATVLFTWTFFGVRTGSGCFSVEVSDDTCGSADASEALSGTVATGGTGGAGGSVDANVERWAKP
jgi:hypothetical protein